MFSHILGIVIPTDFYIFQRGRSTTNQIVICPDHWWSPGDGACRCQQLAARCHRSEPPQLGLQPHTSAGQEGLGGRGGIFWGVLKAMFVLDLFLYLLFYQHILQSVFVFSILESLESSFSINFDKRQRIGFVVSCWVLVYTTCLDVAGGCPTAGLQVEIFGCRASGREEGPGRG